MMNAIRSNFEDGKQTVINRYQREANRNQPPSQQRQAQQPVQYPNQYSNQYQPPPQPPPYRQNGRRDSNIPDHRLQVNQRCIYERKLPGESYITAHVDRIQCGFYDSQRIHEDSIEDVRFVAMNFVFHPSRTTSRFRSANISISLHDDSGDMNHPPPIFDPPALEEKSQRKPKFLRHAPHLLYGSVSPETLNWNFNLAGSLGVAQAPISASIAPSAGLKSSYKVYQMMKIQGSVRTLRSWYGREYDIEDGELVWTLEENSLQKSGLPREFTFVMLLTKGDAKNVVFDVNIEPRVASWFGHYPNWYIHLPQYEPLEKDPINLDQEVGQTFQPVEDPRRGFNFATLNSTFDDLIYLPGTTYSTTDKPPPSLDTEMARKLQGNSGSSGQKQAGDGGSGDGGIDSSDVLKLLGGTGGSGGGTGNSQPAQAMTIIPENINVRLFLEGSRRPSSIITSRSPLPEPQDENRGQHSKRSINIVSSSQPRRSPSQPRDQTQTQHVSNRRSSKRSDSRPIQTQTQNRQPATSSSPPIQQDEYSPPSQPRNHSLRHSRSRSELRNSGLWQETYLQQQSHPNQDQHPPTPTNKIRSRPRNTQSTINTNTTNRSTTGDTYSYPSPQRYSYPSSIPDNHVAIYPPTFPNEMNTQSINSQGMNNQGIDRRRSSAYRNATQKALRLAELESEPEPGVNTI